MKANYRLFKQGGGRSAFAHVYVKIAHRSPSAPEVVVMVDPEEHTSVSPNQDPEFFEAASQGCIDVLRLSNTNIRDINRYQVIITRLIINLVDTRSDAVRTAAFLATAAALGIGNMYQPVFEGVWKIVRQGDQEIS